MVQCNLQPLPASSAFCRRDSCSGITVTTKNNTINSRRKTNKAKQKVNMKTKCYKFWHEIIIHSIPSDRLIFFSTCSFEIVYYFLHLHLKTTSWVGNFTIRTTRSSGVWGWVTVSVLCVTFAVSFLPYTCTDVLCTFTLTRNGVCLHNPTKTKWERNVM